MTLCDAFDEVFGPGLGPACTLPAGHDGAHEAICQATGRHVSTWTDLPGTADVAAEPEAP